MSSIFQPAPLPGRRLAESFQTPNLKRKVLEQHFLLLAWLQALSTPYGLLLDHWSAVDVEAAQASQR
jgi:hypothetical protein